MKDCDVVLVAVMSLDLSVHYGSFDARTFPDPSYRKAFGVASPEPSSALVLEEAVCRAEYKLIEACMRNSATYPGTFTFPENAQVGIDVGASPGGWSHYLSAHCAKVLSIDPGDMKPMPSNVVHMKKRVEECLDELTKANDIDALVCDMNSSSECLCEFVVKAPCSPA